MKIKGHLLIVILFACLAGCGFRQRGPVTDYRPADRTVPSHSFSGELRLEQEWKIRGSVNSPIVAWDSLIGFATTRNRVVILSQSDGDQKRQIRRRWGILVEPLFIDSFLVLIRTVPLGQLEVIDLQTGHIRFKRLLSDVRTAPITGISGIICGTSDGVHCLSFPDLGTAWKYSFGGAVDETPLIYNGAIFCANSKGKLSCLDAATGDERWVVDLGAPASSDLGLGDRLYVGLADGRVVAIDPATGAVVWTYNSGLPIRGGAVEEDGLVFVGGADGKLYCLNAATGRKVWEYQTEGVIEATPLLWGRAVLFGSRDKHFYSLDRATGGLIARQKLEGPITEAAVAANGKIFVGCRKNRLYAFRGNE